jgi:hypothetical protein
MPDKVLIAAFGYGLGLTGRNKFYYQIFLRLYAPRCQISFASREPQSASRLGRACARVHESSLSWDRDIAAASRAVATLVGFTFLPKSIPDLRAPSGRARNLRKLAAIRTPCRFRFSLERVSSKGRSRKSKDDNRPLSPFSPPSSHISRSSFRDSWVRSAGSRAKV